MGEVNKMKAWEKRERGKGRVVDVKIRRSTPEVNWWDAEGREGKSRRAGAGQVWVEYTPP